MEEKCRLVIYRIIYLKYYTLYKILNLSYKTVEKLYYFDLNYKLLNQVTFPSHIIYTYIYIYP